MCSRIESEIYPLVGELLYDLHAYICRSLCLYSAFNNCIFFNYPNPSGEKYEVFLKESSFMGGFNYSGDD